MQQRKEKKKKEGQKNDVVEVLDAVHAAHNTQRKKEEKVRWPKEEGKKHTRTENERRRTTVKSRGKGCSLRTARQTYLVRKYKHETAKEKERGEKQTHSRTTN